MGFAGGFFINCPNYGVQFNGNVALIVAAEGIMASFVLLIFGIVNYKKSKKHISTSFHSLTTYINIVAQTQKRFEILLQTKQGILYKNNIKHGDWISGGPSKCGKNSRFFDHMKLEKELDIYIDETGDQPIYSVDNPLYIVSFVCIESLDSNENAI